MKKFLTRNWHLLLFFSLIALFILVGSVVTQFRLFPEIWTKLSSDSWWADTTISLVLFSALISGLVYLVQEFREKMASRPYLNCKLEIRGFGDTAPIPIHWEDARKFHDNPFEEWKFIKHSVSSYCRIKTASRNEAHKSWYWVEKQTPSREYPFRYVIDFTKMDPDKDVSEWTYSVPPEGFEKTPIQEKENQAELRQTIKKTSGTKRSDPA